jgi:hypothetical protein
MEIVIFSSFQKSISQYEIANYIDVNMPLSTEHSNKINNVNYTDDSSKWGIVLNEDSVNKFFFDSNLNLEEKYLRISHFSEECFVDEIKKHLNKNEHIICGFDYNYLYNINSTDKI